MKVVVFGATGGQGRAQFERLPEFGHTAFAAVRNPDRIKGNAVHADFGDHASLVRALDGMDAVLMNLPSTTFQVAAPLIEAAEVIAKAAARSPTVKMLAFNTSMPMPAQKLGFASQDARIEMRQRIFASGVPAVVLQPGVFLDNIFESWAWPRLESENRLVYAHRETLDVSWISHHDIAALMISAIERPALAGRWFAIGGPETVRGPELVKRLSAAWGRDIAFTSQTVEDFGEGMRRALAGRASLDAERMVNELVRLYRWYNDSLERPFYVDMEPVLREIPAKLTSIRDWAASHRQPRGDR
jgi:uncharacterized protein YbjT (DUF2867 family)